MRLQPNEDVCISLDTKARMQDAARDAHCITHQAQVLHVRSKWRERAQVEARVTQPPAYQVRAPACVCQAARICCV